MQLFVSFASSEGRSIIGYLDAHHKGEYRRTADIKTDGFKSLSLHIGFRHVKMTAHHPDDGGSKYLRNVGHLLRDYTLQYPRSLPSFTRWRENLKFQTS
jgi:hypothetical protein